MLTQSPDLLSLMLVTTTIGLTMLFAGVKKRRLTWRDDKRKRRPR